jgi:magnesium-transporting ATPase (P-type)
MSIIVRSLQDSNLWLLCKGADSIIEQRLKKTPSNDETMKKTNQFLHTIANEGLRTLLLAQKQLNEDEFVTWEAKYLAA